MSDSKKHVRLDKSLSPWHIGALALGCIIGWGCFALPTTKFLPDAGPVGSFLGIGIGAVALCFVSVSYSYMIERFPVAGGEYAYAYAGFGPKMAFVCGWALALGYVSIVALSASAVGMISGHLFPAFFKNPEFIIYIIEGDTVNWASVVLMSAMIILFGIMNYVGVKIAGGVQILLSLALVFGVVALFIGVLFTDSFSLANLSPVLGSGDVGSSSFPTGQGKSAFSGVLSILAVAPFLFVGFDTIPQAAEEFSFSPKKSRNLMLLSIGIGALMYCLMIFAVGSFRPYPDILRQFWYESWSVGAVIQEALGTTGVVILSIGVFGAVCAGMNGFYLATTRLLFAMARGRFLPAWFGKTHPRYKTPHNAVLFTILIALLTPWAGRSVVIWIVEMCSVGTAIAYLFTCLTACRSGAGSRVVSLTGTVVSLIILGLLVIPGSPGAIGTEPWICLGVWSVPGIVFYFIQAPAVRAVPLSSMKASLFGDENIPVFFK